MAINFLEFNVDFLLSTKYLVKSIWERWGRLLLCCMYVSMLFLTLVGFLHDLLVFWYYPYKHSPLINHSRSRSLLLPCFSQSQISFYWCWKTQLCPNFYHVADDLGRIVDNFAPWSTGKETVPQHDATLTVLGN